VSAEGPAWPAPPAASDLPPDRLELALGQSARPAIKADELLPVDLRLLEHAEASSTCSHHGDVAVWLDTSNPSAARTSATGAPPPVNVGRTVLLEPRTRTNGCRRGREPDQRSHRAASSRSSRAIPAPSSGWAGCRASASTTTCARSSSGARVSTSSGIRVCASARSLGFYATACSDAFSLRGRAASCTPPKPARQDPPASLSHP
jgi:hypothetical protein